MRHSRHSGIVHLELHTDGQAEVRAFLWQLLGWRSWPVGPPGLDYHALAIGDRMGGGILGCGQQPPSWLPYVSVADVRRVTDQASQLGADVLLAPRKGPQGWRSIVTTPASGDLALWQPTAGHTRRCP